MTIRKRKNEFKATDKDPRLYDALWKEYSILQAKLDKFGDFKFKIFGWLISLYTAITVGVLSCDPGFWVSFFVYFIPLIIFFLKELDQIQIQNAFSSRLGKIEEALVSYFGNEVKDLPYVISKGAPRITETAFTNASEKVLNKQIAFLLKLGCKEKHLSGMQKSLTSGVKHSFVISYILLLLYAFGMSLASCFLDFGDRL